MSKTLFEKLQYMASLGKDSIVKTKEGKYVIVSWMRDENGHLQNTFPLDSLQSPELRQFYSAQRECIWGDREAAGWTFFGELPRPEFERFKDGDKVKMWNEDVGKFITEGEVKAADYNKLIYSVRNEQGGFDPIPHHQLTPVFEEEKEESKTIVLEPKTIVLEGKEYYLTPKE